MRMTTLLLPGLPLLAVAVAACAPPGRPVPSDLAELRGDATPLGAKRPARRCHVELRPAVHDTIVAQATLEDGCRFGPFLVPGGGYRLTVEANGYEMASRHLGLDPGQQARVSVPLVAKPGLLSVGPGDPAMTAP